MTPLPGSHDELVPGGIKSKLGEIPDSRVGEVRDPRLQIWQRQGETLLLLLDRVFKFSGITPEKITPAEVQCRAEAPRRPGFRLPTSASVASLLSSGIRVLFSASGRGLALHKGKPMITLDPCRGSKAATSVHLWFALPPDPRLH